MSKKNTMEVNPYKGDKAHAEYGCKLLKVLSAYLTKRLGRGFSEMKLWNAKKFFQVYAASIQQSLTAESGKTMKYSFPLVCRICLTLQKGGDTYDLQKT